jgi:hypothetical protein
MVVEPKRDDLAVGLVERFDERDDALTQVLPLCEIRRVCGVRRARSKAAQRGRAARSGLRGR